MAAVCGQIEMDKMVFWQTPFVYGLAKPVVISSSLIPRLHWWSGNSRNGIPSIH